MLIVYVLQFVGWEIYHKKHSKVEKLVFLIQAPLNTAAGPQRNVFLLTCTAWIRKVKRAIWAGWAFVWFAHRTDAMRSSASWHIDLLV